MASDNYPLLAKAPRGKGARSKKARARRRARQEKHEESLRSAATQRSAAALPSAT